MWFNLPILEENLIKINVCVLVCTLVAFARLLILVEVLAFFNFKKMTFCIVGPEIWSQNMIPFLNKIILEQNEKKTVSQSHEIFIYMLCFSFCYIVLSIKNFRTPCLSRLKDYINFLFSPMHTPVTCKLTCYRMTSFSKNLLDIFALIRRYLH